MRNNQVASSSSTVVNIQSVEMVPPAPDLIDVVNHPHHQVTNNLRGEELDEKWMTDQVRIFINVNFFGYNIKSFINIFY